MAVKTGTFGAEAAVSGVRSMSLSWNNAFDTEDYTAGSTGLKAEQIRNGTVGITGSLSVDWLTTSKTVFEDLRVANTSTSLVFKWTGALIASTYYYDLEICLPGVFFTGDSPSISGPDVPQVDYGFEWKYDGTNLAVHQVHVHHSHRHRLATSSPPRAAVGNLSAALPARGRCVHHTNAEGRAHDRDLTINDQDIKNLVKVMRARAGPAPSRCAGRSAHVVAPVVRT